MKQILCSVIMSVVTIGAAFALPSPSDRKLQCEKEVGMVWVEKNQACVPVNTCASSVDSNISDVYCINDGRFVIPKDDKTVRDLIINKYVEKVLKTTASKIEQFGDGFSDVVCTSTVDGRYFCVNAIYPVDVFEKGCGNAVETAFISHGFDIADVLLTLSFVHYSVEDIDSTTCSEVGDFAALLHGKGIKKDVIRGRCSLTCVNQ